MGTGVSVSSISVVGTIGVGAQSIAISTVESISLGLRLGISRPLGDMDNSGAVGDISASSGISSTDGGDGRVSKSEGGQGGGGADLGGGSGECIGTIGVRGIGSDGGGSGNCGHGGSSDSDSGGSGIGGIGVGTIGVGVSSKTGVSVSSISVVGTIGVGAQSIAISTVESISLGLRLGISRPLGDMDDSSRVGDISASAGISSSHGGDGGLGEAKGGLSRRGAHLGVGS